MTDYSREILKRQIDVCPWSMLSPHMEKGNVFVVAVGLDFLDVADAIRRDDKQAVLAWVTSGDLSRPAPETLAGWAEVPEKSFRMVIVKPFLLIQEVHDA